MKQRLVTTNVRKMAAGAASASTARATTTTTCGDDNILYQCPRGTRDLGPREMAFQNQVLKVVRAEFLCHGAEPMDTPLLERRETLESEGATEEGATSKLIYHLADEGGHEALAIRYDQTIGFARYLANHAVTNMKRCQEGMVGRRDSPVMARGRYRLFRQADFDIAGDFEMKMAADAECLVLVRKICDAFASDVGPSTIRVNHVGLLKGMLRLCGVKAGDQALVCSSIDKLDKCTWPEVAAELKTKGQSDTIVSKLHKFLASTGSCTGGGGGGGGAGGAGADAAVVVAGRTVLSLDECLALLNAEEATLMLNSDDDCKRALFEMKQFNDCYNAMTACASEDKKDDSDASAKRGKSTIVWDLGLARGLSYYTGWLVEAGFNDFASFGSVAAGGRYDTLVSKFCSRHVPIVGVSIGVDRIACILEAAAASRGSTPVASARSSIQVLVCVIGLTSAGTTEMTKRLGNARLAVCGELWGAGIACEMFYHSNPSRDAQLESALKRGIPCIVWIGPTELEKGACSVKMLDARKQQLVLRKDLVAHLRGALKPSSSSSL